MEGLPALSMSQNTLASTQNSSVFHTVADAGTSRKRTYEEDIEDDMDAFFDEVDVAETASESRVIAKPKSTLRQAITEPEIVIMDGGDFDDAPFLAPMDVD